MRLLTSCSAMLGPYQVLDAQFLAEGLDILLTGGYRAGRPVDEACGEVVRIKHQKTDDSNNSIMVLLRPVARATQRQAHTKARIPGLMLAQVSAISRAFRTDVKAFRDCIFAEVTALATRGDQRANQAVTRCIRANTGKHTALLSQSDDNLQTGRDSSQQCLKLTTARHTR